MRVSFAVVTIFSVLTVLADFPVALADEVPPTYELHIKDHKFDKPELVVKAGVKFILIVFNDDTSFEEFESKKMIVEKIIGPKAKIKLNLGPFAAGTYDYFGEFHHATAQGQMKAQ
jgi:hypothetical protein